jgi:hypothetical protein
MEMLYSNFALDSRSSKGLAGNDEKRDCLDAAGRFIFCGVWWVCLFLFLLAAIEMAMILRFLTTLHLPPASHEIQEFRHRDNGSVKLPGLTRQ